MVIWSTSLNGARHCITYAWKRKSMTLHTIATADYHRSPLIMQKRSCSILNLTTCDRILISGPQLKLKLSKV